MQCDHYQLKTTKCRGSWSYDVEQKYVKDGPETISIKASKLRRQNWTAVYYVYDKYDQIK